VNRAARDSIPLNTAIPAPARVVFHGWWVVAALFLSGFMLFGGGLYAFILMVPVLTEEFHWSRAATGGLVSTFWLAAPIALFGGMLLKRYGPRRVFAAGVLIEAVCVLIFAMVSSLATMYVLRTLMGLGKVLFAVSIPVVISRWFSRHFGLGCAIAWAGWHAGGLVLAPIAGALIRSYGWRTACVGLGFAMIVIGLLPALWALRIETPEQMGLARDGAPLAPPVRGTRYPQRSERDISLYRTLFMSPAFWLIATGTVLFWFVYAGTLAHQSALIEESGVSPRWASLALGSTAAFAAVGTLIIGWVTDRWRVVGVAILEHGLLLAGVLGLLLFTRTHALLPLIVHMACFGMAIGGGDVFWTTVLKRLLGDEIFAYSYSIWYFFVVIVLLIGPIVAGSLYDATGNYTVALMVLAAAAAAAGSVALVVAARTPA
jgi:MFS family permease